MGLNVTHNCWSGPYSSFNEFRYALATQIGIDLNDYIGYGSSNATKELTSIDNDLMALFNHSDCEGELSVNDSIAIVKGLQSVLINLNERSLPYPNFKNDIIKFRDGCLRAFLKNEIIKFR